ncbi:MAG: alpha/beta hydrolase [Phenylobacterium sp.]|nr:MAG: alpha/beta hydrolase [Phenylobacterium sp.]
MRDWRFWGLALLCLLGAAVVAGRVFELTSEARDDRQVPMPGKLVAVGGGRQLHLLCSGPAGGPTVVMIAGGGTPAVVSYALQAKIARFAHVCSYDRPGLGWSPPAARPLTFDEHVQDLESLLHNGGVPGPYLFAPESFGSLIAIGYADRHPDQTAGAVFLDGVDPQLWFAAVPAQNGWDADARTAAFGAAWRLGVVRLAFAKLAPPWVNVLPPTTRDQLRAVYARPAAGFDEAIQAYRRSPADHRPVLTPAMFGDRPVIAIQHGKTSAALSSTFQAGWAASQARLAAASRAGRVVVAEGADHQVAQEAPDLAARSVREAMIAVAGHR